MSCKSWEILASRSDILLASSDLSCSFLLSFSSLFSLLRSSRSSLSFSCIFLARSSSAFLSSATSGSWLVVAGAFFGGGRTAELPRAGVVTTVPAEGVPRGGVAIGGGATDWPAPGLGMFVVGGRTVVGSA